MSSVIFKHLKRTRDVFFLYPSSTLDVDHAHLFWARSSKLIEPTHIELKLESKENPNHHFRLHFVIKKDNSFHFADYDIRIFSLIRLPKEISPQELHEYEM